VRVSTNLVKLRRHDLKAKELRLPIIRPTLPALDVICAIVRDGWIEGSVTVGATVARFEEAVREKTGAAYAIAVSSCTAGLMLIPKALSLAPGGEVIVPSFTFAATAQALLWNGLVPVFCDCDPETKTLAPEDVKRNLSSRTVAICPAYVFGLPPEIDEILKIGQSAGVPVYFDSAQGLGSTYRGKSAGSFGTCEVFSLSPTKVITAIEGGVITTDDSEIADKLRSMRDYGKDPHFGEEMIWLGLSARMSEFHAAVGLISIKNAHKLVHDRMERISKYRNRLGKLNGCTVQEYPVNRTTSGNYFVLFVTADARITRDELYAALKENGIQTKRYFYPPLHQHKVFESYPHRSSDRLQCSVVAAQTGLALPLYSHMTDADIEEVCRRVEQLLS
jgi:dTDP-4-amino-4,6-dideoxygalactose transaminase